jgi:hypothetical protein
VNGGKAKKGKKGAKGQPVSRPTGRKGEAKDLLMLFPGIKPGKPRPEAPLK